MMTVPQNSPPAVNGDNASLGKTTNGIDVDEVHLGNSPSGLSKLPPSDATAVCKQIDYYFSDENLVQDNFLLGKMRGRKNKPIPFKKIHDFKKMRQYQPESAVLDALRISKSVTVVREGGDWCLQRKTPFIKEEVTGAKKTASKKPPKPSGFEEWYTEPPLTVEDSKVEENLYDPSRPIIPRLEVALQRYQAKRKFDSHIKNIFQKWMRLGGVDSGPKQFSGGLDHHEDKGEKTAKDIAAVNATTYIRGEEMDDVGNPLWKIDFLGVAKCFLSSQVPMLWDWEDESRIKECTNVLRNFYRYLLLHKVCPEYQEEIREASRICDIADTELLSTRRATSLFLGDFNVACSTLFGGQCQGLYAENQLWTQEDKSASITSGMSLLRARQVFSLCISAHSETDDFLGDQKSRRTKLLDQKIVKEEDELGYEVVEVLHPPDEVVQFYQSFRAGLRPTGRLRCRLWADPDVEIEEDLPPRVESQLPHCGENAREDDFFVEQDILDWCFPGMKIEALVKTLSGGIKFLDNIISTKCSFYQSLPNELMRGWKEPRWISREEQNERMARLAAFGRGDGGEEGEEAGQLD